MRVQVLILSLTFLLSACGRQAETAASTKSNSGSTESQDCSVLEGITTMEYSPHTCKMIVTVNGKKKTFSQSGSNRGEATIKVKVAACEAGADVDLLQVVSATCSPK